MAGSTLATHGASFSPVKRGVNSSAGHPSDSTKCGGTQRFIAYGFPGNKGDAIPVLLSKAMGGVPAELAAWSRANIFVYPEFVIGHTFFTHRQSGMF